MSIRDRLARTSLSPRLRQLYGNLRGVPLLGSILRSLVRNLLPSGMRVWDRVPAGAAKGLWLCADPRYETN